MDVKEETAKSLVGKIVAGILALIALLFLAIWRAALYLVWVQVEAGVSKQVLWALLGLAVIIITLETALIGYFLYDNRKRKRTPLPSPLEPVLPRLEPKPLRMHGLLWDKDFNPLCPADQTLLFIAMRNDKTGGGSYDILKCAKCGVTFPLRLDVYGLVTLARMKQTVQIKFQISD